MTLSALLGELKVVDPEIELEISDIILNLDQWSKPYEADIIQGCIQRACKRKDWFYGQFSMSHPGPYSADITDANNVDNHWFGAGNSPAEAILTAYVTAVTGGT